MTTETQRISRPGCRHIDLNPQPFIQTRKRQPQHREVVRRPPQIERTQSWEWKDAQKEKNPQIRLPDVISIPSSYFGLPIPRRPYLRAFSSLHSPVNHERPFYPPGAPYSPTREGRKLKIAETRSIYRNNQYKRTRSHSEPVNLTASKYYKFKQRSRSQVRIEHPLKSRLCQVGKR